MSYAWKRIGKFREICASFIASLQESLESSKLKCLISEWVRMRLITDWPTSEDNFSRHSRNHSDQGWRKCLMQSPNVYIEFPHLHDDWDLFNLHFSIAKNTYNLRRLFMASPSPHRYQPRGRCCFSVCRSAIISSDQLGARDVWSAWDAEKMLQKLNLKVMKIVSVCSAIDDITSHVEWNIFISVSRSRWKIEHSKNFYIERELPPIVFAVRFPPYEGAFSNANWNLCHVAVLIVESLLTSLFLSMINQFSC